MAGRVALVTGGATGIGAAIACRYAEEGANVAIVGRRAEPLEAVAASINERAGGRCMAVPGDISVESDVEAAFACTVDAFGRVDVLVNNAAIAGPVAPITEISMQGWQECVEINLTGAFLCSRAAARQMIPNRWGKIVSIGSISGKRPLASRSPYCATKLAIVGLTRSLALELGPHNINVNVISPGAVDTPRLSELAEKYNVTLEEVIKSSAEKRCLQRIPTTQSISDLAVFLATDRSKDITGFDITVDAGGWFT
jgi:3-hydroxybutyrate dehydrogenase/3-oxoacyl-[acyl-carrier protein] reductase